MFSAFIINYKIHVFSSVSNERLGYPLGQEQSNTNYVSNQRGKGNLQFKSMLMNEKYFSRYVTALV